MTSQFKKDLTNIMQNARNVHKKDLIKLQSLTAAKRRNQYETILQDLDKFENEFKRKYSDKIRDMNIDKRQGEFEAALLYLHVASLEDPNAEPIDPERFFEDEIEALREFDRYRAFDVSDEEDLNDRIENKDEEIYEFVVKEVTEQREQRADIFESQYNKIRGELIEYLGDEYKQRENMSESAVGKYIEQHGLPKAIESIEDAVSAKLGATETRQSTRKMVEEVMEEFSKRVMESLHGQEQSLLAEINAIEQRIEKGDIGDSDIDSDLNKIHENIKELKSVRNEEIDEFSNVLSDLKTERDRLDSKIEEIEAKQQQATQEAARIATEATTDKSVELLDQAKKELEEELANIQAEVDQLEREREKRDLGTQRLEKKYEKVSERIENLETSVSPDVDTDTVATVRSEDARLFELDYIGRIKSSLKNTDSVILPGGDTFDIPRGYWNNRSHISPDDDREKMKSWLGEEASISNYPIGRSITGSFRESNYLASSDELIIKASVILHLEAYAKNGYDKTAAGVSDLLDCINETIDEASQAGVPHIIAAASPTGWTDDVIEKVEQATFSRTRFGENISVYLIDLLDDQIYYDRADDVLVANESIVTRENKEERVAECKRKLRTEFIDQTTDVTMLKDVVAETEFEASVVNEAFESIEQTEQAQIHNTEYGLALDTK